MVYEPREDSFILQKEVEKYAHGRVLDMGAGSGIQALAAAKKAESVLAVDIDNEAVEQLKKKTRGMKNISVLQSDLFSEVSGKFDLIIFNPPYLPNDEEFNDPALHGGKEGYETIKRFLEQAKTHLAEKGIILLLFSSLSDKDKVEEILVQNSYAYEQLSSLKLSFEELYVYRISAL